eukprot:3937937-Rhodomonas_salina.1
MKDSRFSISKVEHRVIACESPPITRGPPVGSYPGTPVPGVPAFSGGYLGTPGTLPGVLSRGVENSCRSQTQLGAPIVRTAGANS